MTKIISQITTGNGGEFESANKINNLYVSQNIFSNIISFSKNEIFQKKIFDEIIITPSDLIKLRKQLTKTDIVFFNCLFNYSYLIILLFIKIVLHKKVVVFFRTDDGKSSLLKKIYFYIRKTILLNFSLLIAEKIIFLTNQQKKKFSNYTLYKREFNNKCRVLYNFIEDNFVLKQDKKFNQEMKIIFIGRLTKEKGFHDFARVSNEYGAKFGAIGQPIKNTQYGKNIKFFGKVSNEKINKIIDQYDILILPSYGETFGRVIIEGMARGLIILSSNLSSIREYFKEGINGYMFEPGDTERIIQLLDDLKSSPEKMNRISKNNIRAAQRFTAKKQVQNYINLYNEISK